MKEHIKRVDRILKYKGSILDIYTDVIETPDGHRAEWDYIDHRGAAAVVPVFLPTPVGPRSSTLLLAKSTLSSFEKARL